jgi:outer membrane protein insertion porin family
LSTSLRTSFNYIGYDPSQFRPFDAELRTNLDDWQWITRWGITATLDQRRGISILSPTSGYAVSQGVTFVGGFLLGDRHYIRTDTRGEAYITLWDIPVWDRWNYKTILALHSDISFILPTFWVPAAYRSMEQPVAGTDLLRTNMMFIARGWDPVTGGEALWNNWVEFRTPIAENILWLDSFFDAVNLWEDPSQIGTMGIENMLFGFGTGIRFTIPQFPIRLYLAKRFRFDESGSVQWQQGTLFNYNDSPTGGLDFVFAIGADLF